MSSPTLPLSNIVYVTVQVQPNAVAPPAFNQALIVGNSAVIPTYGVGGRVVLFSGGTSILQQMISYGFTVTDPEYLAAQNFLAASSDPYFLAIGKQDTTAIDGYAIDAAGTDYAVGDYVYITSVANSLFKVTAVSAGGVPTQLTMIPGGTAASITAGLHTTTSR